MALQPPPLLGRLMKLLLHSSAGRPATGIREQTRFVTPRVHVSILAVRCQNGRSSQLVRRGCRVASACKVHHEETSVVLASLLRVSIPCAERAVDWRNTDIGGGRQRRPVRL